MLTKLSLLINFIQMNYRTHEFWVAGFAMFWFFSENTFHYGTNLLFDFINYLALIISTILIILYVLKNRLSIPRIWVLLLTVHAAFVITFICSKNNTYDVILTDSFIRFAIFGGLGFLLVTLIRDGRLLLTWFIIFALFVLVLIIRQIGIIGWENTSKYYMTLSYQLLYIALVIPVICLYHNAKLVSMISSFIFLCLLIFIGTRGAIIAFLSTIILTLLLVRRREAFRLLFFVMFFSFIATTILIFLSGISLSSLTQQWASQFNEQSRMARLFNSDKTTWDSNRSSYYKVIQKGISDNPLGAGIGQDRILLNKTGVTESNKSYAHNIYLEVLYHFGLFVGLILLLLLHYQMIISVLKSQDQHWQMMALLCIGIWFFPRIFSSSYLVPQTLVVIGIFYRSYSKLRIFQLFRDKNSLTNHHYSTLRT